MKKNHRLTNGLNDIWDGLKDSYFGENAYLKMNSASNRTTNEGDKKARVEALIDAQAQEDEAALSED